MEYIPYEHNIQYYETDQMGIVHHSNDIRFVEEARNDLLCQLGLPYEKVEQAGLPVPVLTVFCECRLPARYRERLLISGTPSVFHRPGRFRDPDRWRGPDSG